MDDHHTLNDLVASEIRGWLGKRRMSGRQLAAKLDVSQTWMSTRLRGTTEIGLAELERIAEALGVEVSELLPASTTRRGSDAQIKGSWPHPPERPTAGIHRLLPDCDHHDRTPQPDSHPVPTHPRHVRPGARRPAVQSWTDAGVTS